MTAAHVIQAMDEITVEFIGGETVRARISSEPAADLEPLQLERVPAAGQGARLAGDSDTVRVGDHVMIVGAPYGLSHR